MNQHSALLTVDLSALSHNWRALSQIYTGEDCGAVVKADAYGLGVGPVAEVLWQVGCRTFYVANFDEGLQLRSLLPSLSRVFVLQGCVAGMEQAFVDNELTPVLVSRVMCERWLSFVDRSGGQSEIPVALKINTGMNRLGLSMPEFDSLVERNLLQTLNVRHLFSHLACADEPSHPLNHIQLERFSDLVVKARKQVPEIGASLVNSAGMFLGKAWQFDLARPGIALYGGLTIAGHDFRRVVSLGVPVLQLRSLKAGESIGYGATFTAKTDMRVAVTAGGYADGIIRFVSNRAMGWYRGPVPICGRVSMDSLVFDVSALPEEELPVEGELIELIGEHCLLSEFALAAGTITYEVLTSLGDRLKRVYSGG